MDYEIRSDRNGKEVLVFLTPTEQWSRILSMDDLKETGQNRRFSKSARRTKKDKYINLIYSSKGSDETQDKRPSRLPNH